jgi:DNA-directed RNA polymerase beta subunit
MPVSVENPPKDFKVEKKIKRDASLALRSSETGVVESVMLTMSSRGFRYAKVLEKIVFQFFLYRRHDNV